MTFKVVPLCDKQLRDIREDDILENGLYRKCETYRSGGGYDKFPEICNRRYGVPYSKQFVVQLYGCPLQCNYCYVTNDGVHGKYVEVGDKQIINSFIKSEQEILHLMGGAPALYIEEWYKLLDLLPVKYIFHSDLLLIEKEYKLHVLKNVARENAIYAIGLKGVDEETYYINTGRKLNKGLLMNNLDKVHASGINFYITLTNPPTDREWTLVNQIRDKYDDSIMDDFFTIDVIHYNALN